MTYPEQIETAVRAVKLSNDTTFSWLGDRIKLLHGRSRHLKPEGEGFRQLLIGSLQSTLYSNFYIHGQTRKGEVPRDAALPLRGLTTFTDSLCRSIANPGYLEHGWRVVSDPSANVVEVEKDNLRVIAQMDSVVTGQGDALKSGHLISLRVASHYLAVSPGYFMVKGGGALKTSLDGDLIRTYWNLDSQGAAAFIASVTSKLDELLIPYNVKVIGNENDYDRCDAGVVYLRKDDFCVASHQLSEVWQDVRCDLRAAVPAFTKSLAPGVGLAENPRTHDSFGMHCCGLIAEGIVRANEAQKHLLSDRLESVFDCFRDQSGGPDAPFLCRKSVDNYPTFPQLPDAKRARGRNGPRTKPQNALNTSILIGQYLVDQAHCYEDKCTWLGPHYAVQHALKPMPERSVTLGADLYLGTSGVGTFLAELYRATGDSSFLRHSRGAMWHAFAHSVKFEGPQRLGLFTGLGGVGWAMVHNGATLQDTEMMERGVDLLLSIDDANFDNADHDYLSGTAGYIVSLLSVHACIRDKRLVEQAKAFGNRLCAEIDQSGFGRAAAKSKSPPAFRLTGLSHGVSGVAKALTELYSVAPEKRFRELALAAFTYEDTHRVPEERTWRDLRPKKIRGSLHPMHWCYGAPGIAVARMRAAKVLACTQCAATAQIALNDTLNHVLECFLDDDDNMNLCHGALGCAEILRMAARDCSEETFAKTAKEAVARVAEATCKTVNAADTITGSPSIMLGITGVGIFLLGFATDRPFSILSHENRIAEKLGTTA